VTGRPLSEANPGHRSNILLCASFPLASVLNEENIRPAEGQLALVVRQTRHVDNSLRAVDGAERGVACTTPSLPFRKKKMRIENSRNEQSQQHLFFFRFFLFTN
jgi:hypothetical protein